MSLFAESSSFLSLLFIFYVLQSILFCNFYFLSFFLHLPLCLHFFFRLLFLIFLFLHLFIIHGIPSFFLIICLSFFRFVFLLLFSSACLPVHAYFSPSLFLVLKNKAKTLTKVSFLHPPFRLLLSAMYCDFGEGKRNRESFSRNTRLAGAVLSVSLKHNYICSFGSVKML